MKKQGIKINKHEKFDGTFKDLQRIINVYIKPNFPQIIFTTKESVTTNSYYLYMSKDNNTIAVRFSDHASIKNIPSYTLKSLRKSKGVVAAIIHNINRLNRKSVYDKLHKLGGE